MRTTGSRKRQRPEYDLACPASPLWGDQFPGNRQQAGLPQGPASIGGQPPASGSDPPFITGAAVALKSLSSFREPHVGQTGVSPLRTRSSTSWLQSSQRYSNSGMIGRLRSEEWTPWVPERISSFAPPVQTYPDTRKNGRRFARLVPRAGSVSARSDPAPASLIFTRAYVPAATCCVAHSASNSRLIFAL